MNIKVATGLKCTSKTWKNTQYEWLDFVERLRKTTHTSESMAEYANMPKKQKDAIKDVGGFVGGSLKNGSRKAQNVIDRSVITLDADYATEDFMEALKSSDYEFVVYSTHSHTPDRYRLRIVIPMTGNVTPDMYQAISRMLARSIDMEAFDDTTYQPHRLMYWPSTCQNGEYIFHHNEGKFLDPQDVLRMYGEGDTWKDSSLWPVSKRVDKARTSAIKQQGDPLSKDGVIGAFCRTYDIHAAIETFLSDEYLSCADPNRYTFAHGSTHAGVVVYEDKFVYSNHATDPISGKLCNVWDLVRIHKFGDRDDEADPGTPSCRMPSFSEMMKLATNDPTTKGLIASENIHRSREDFGVYLEDEEETNGWEKELKIANNGAFVNTLTNMALILSKDKNLRCIARNMQSDSIELKDNKLPWKSPNKYWRDADDAQLQCYVDKIYNGAFSKNNILTALEKVADDRSYHPIRDYFNALLEWDGIKRLDTLLIDYLGAEDTELNRAITRKTFTAAVNRIFNPGVTFDAMLVLQGKPGIGKSTLIRILGMDWFSDSLRLTDIKDKTGAEKLQGQWLMEIGELAGLKKTDANTLKTFLSSKSDLFRMAFGRRATPHPRQCIFIGTTNDDDFLTDPTGNRRFWTVRVGANKASKSVWSALPNELDCIWAEAFAHFRAKEELHLNEELEKQLGYIHEGYFVEDPWAGAVYDFLEKRVPADWNSYDFTQRRLFWSDDFGRKDDNLIERDRICIREIWHECLNGDLKNLGSAESRRLTNIMAKAKDWEKHKSTIRCGPYNHQKGYRKK